MSEHTSRIGSRYTNFHDDKRIEEKANLVFAWTLWIGKNAPYRKGEFVNDKKLQHRGHDARLYPYNGPDEFFSVEFKNDFQSTGNIAVEDYHYCVDTGEKSEGWFWRIDSDILYYHVVDTGIIYNLDYRQMRRDREFLKYESVPNRKLNYSPSGRTYRTFNRIIPISECVRCGWIIQEIVVDYPGTLREELNELVYRPTSRVKQTSR